MHRLSLQVQVCYIAIKTFGAHLAVAVLTEGRGQAVAMGLAQHQRGRLLHWRTGVLLKSLLVDLAIALAAVVCSTG